MDIPGVNVKSEKCCAARNSLPEDLRSQFDSLLEDYAFSAFKKYGRAYISYGVIADLIEAGWRGPEPGG